jgi:uncharacterized coiled-coil DUF342 family protein
MTTEDFDELKEKIASAKEKRDNASGVINSSMEELKQLGISSVEAGEKRLEEINEEIENLETKQETIFNNISKITDWDNI